jgi:hypothetical protein
MIDVVAPAGRYRAAVAELPLSARLGESAAGALVVVSGGPGWADASRAAVEEGALAVVVADPVLAPAADVSHLAERTRIPVVLDRPLLRTDAAADARATREGEGGWSAPRTIVLDGAASAARLGVVARDAVGWGRVLTGQSLSVMAADRGLALLQTSAGLTVTLAVVAAQRPGGGWVRAQALGEVITEVDVEGTESRVATVTAAGRLALPRRFESPERVALRRAIAALDAGDLPGDLAELVADTQAVERIMLPRA